MISLSLKTTRRLPRARAFGTTPRRRTLSHLTMGFDEIAAWKGRRLATSSSPSNPKTTEKTTLPSALAGSPFPRRTQSIQHSSLRAASSQSRTADERSASEIPDVPSLVVLGKLHAGPRDSTADSAPDPAPFSGSNTRHENKAVIPKSSLPCGLDALRRLGGVFSLSRRTETSSGTTPDSSTAPTAGGVSLDGGVATASGHEKKDREDKPAKEPEFLRELPMFLGGGLY